MGDDPLQVRADRLRLAGGPAVVLELGAGEHPFDLPAGDRAQRLDPDAGLEREAQVGDGRVDRPAVRASRWPRRSGPRGQARTGPSCRRGSTRRCRRSRFGWSGISRQSQARSETAAWARIRRASGIALGERRPCSRRAPGCRGRRGSGSAPGARAASANRSSTAGSSSVNCSARGCSLIPRAPRSRQRTASATAPSCGSTRQKRDESVGCVAAASSTRVVGRRVAVGLVHRRT